ncbi:class I adenylate-forming enzyme family protein [Actinomadura geliboluensis]|uniref:AMP-dependent synthetase n=1 Tax=Actinomadura geliboluensis TaxID=882440 RepID=A0A5S4H695_9ACTN|nr:AMP-binding protein [Actinomadura geliboluensis]TMR40637.1 AMP-dependent synthetase [Actinomadura geliboluensis]
MSDSDADGVNWSMSRLLRDTAAAHPGNEFVFPQARATFAQLDARADAFAHMLVNAGLKAGEHVGLWVPPSLDMIAAIFGTVRAGGVVVPVSDRFRAAELGHVIDHADLAVVLTSGATSHHDRRAELVAALPSLAGQRSTSLALAEAPKLRRVIVLGDGDGDGDGDSDGDGDGRPGFSSAEEFGLPGTWDAGPYEPVRPDQDVARADDLAYLMYTSGTSARPKACMISHRGVVMQGTSLARTRYRLDADSRFWCPLPLFHTAGLATMIACVASGAGFVHAGVFDPRQSLQAMVEERVTHAIPCFETIWMRVVELPEFATADLSRLRVTMNTGGEDLLRRLQSRTPQAVQLANYGITEGSGHVAMTTPDDPLDLRVTTGGFPLPGMEVRITDLETGEVVPPGARGEIRFRGTSRFLGYYKDPVATAEVIDADGWFSSGDLGEMDADGRVAFRGRIKDMLKVGGENVASLEIESYLLRHPAVSVCAVVGAPDAYYGEVPVAYVQLVPGAELTGQELIDYCVDRIATFKIPRYVRFVDSWPMSGTKIRKVELRARIAAELAAAGITEAPRIRSSRARSRA